MIPWIQVYSNLIQHPKVSRLADELALSSKDTGPNIVAAGMIVSLWLWAAQNATDGDLSECSERAIAWAAGYKKKPAAFVSALIMVKLLDENRSIHDWAEHASLLMDSVEASRENNAKRQQRYRDRKKKKDTQNCNAEIKDERNVTSNVMSNVTKDESNAPTIPNHTIPNQNILSSSIAEDNITAQTFVCLPLNDGKEFPVTDVMVSEFSSLYPAVDVEQALRNMRGWLLNNPKNRKTASGVRRFINSWLSREQDRARPQQKQGYTHGADRLAEMIAGGAFDDEA